jgi:hypothetical protein
VILDTASTFRNQGCFKHIKWIRYFATIVIFMAFQLASAIVHNFIHRLTIVSEIRVVLRDFRNVLEP